LAGNRREAIAGGADALQLREKNLDSAEFLTRARQLTQLCRQNNILCIINDRPDIALAAMRRRPPRPGRLPPSKPAKSSATKNRRHQHHTLPRPNKPSSTAPTTSASPHLQKRNKNPPILRPRLRPPNRTEIKIPAVAIAGINATNVDEVLSTGIKAIAVTAAVIGCENGAISSRHLKEMLTKTGSMGI